MQAIVERLGSIIQGQQDTEDHNLFFNDAFMVRHQAHVRGVLSAITRPTKVSNIINQHGLQERLFFSKSLRVPIMSTVRLYLENHDSGKWVWLGSISLFGAHFPATLYIYLNIPNHLCFM